MSIWLEIVGKGSRATITIGVFTRNVYENRHFVNDAILFVLLFSDELFRFQELTCIPEIAARFQELIPINLHSNKFEFQVDMTEFHLTMSEMAPEALTYWCAHPECLQKNRHLPE